MADESNARPRRLPTAHLVALAELRRRVPVELERHRQRRLGVRRNPFELGAAVAVSVIRPIPTVSMVPIAQQGCPGRGAQGRGVEPGVGEAAALQSLRVRHLRSIPERAAGAESHIVDQHDQHIRRTVRGSSGSTGTNDASGSFRVVGDPPQLSPVRNRQHPAARPCSIHHGVVLSVISSDRARPTVPRASPITDYVATLRCASASPRPDHYPQRDQRLQRQVAGHDNRRRLAASNAAIQGPFRRRSALLMP